MTDTIADTNADYRSIWSYLVQVPFRQDYIDVDGVRVRYCEAGPADGPAVVMLHGTGGHWEAFAANIPAFAQHFHVFAFDMVGAGFSGKPDKEYMVRNLAAFTAAFMRAVGLKKANVVGLSLGAQTALRVAVDFPEMTDKIVLASPVGLARFSPSKEHDVEGEMAKRVAIVADTSWDNTKKIFNNMIRDPKNIVDDFVKVRQMIHRMPNAAKDMLNVLAMGKPDNYAAGALTDDELKGMQAPALVLMSEHDQPFFKMAAKAIAELAPHAKLVEMAGVAHWSQFEDPKTFNEEAINFLQG